jgi:hypothetical protein
MTDIELQDRLFLRGVGITLGDRTVDAALEVEMAYSRQVEAKLREAEVALCWAHRARNLWAGAALLLGFALVVNGLLLWVMWG